MLVSHMDTIISDAAELYLQMLRADFSCERGNIMIQSRHAKFASMGECDMAMLRLAYLKGREDATATPADFDADMARVMAANEAAATPKRKLASSE